MNVIKYIQEAQAELKKVVWPNRKETTNYTIMVIALSLLVALYLGVVDYILNTLLQTIL